MRRRSGGKRFWLSVFSATLLFIAFLSPCLFMTRRSFAESGIGCDGIDWPASYKLSGSDEGWSSVVTKVKNPSAASGNAFLDDVWAKPGDSVTWRHCYFPGAQKVIATQSVTINHVKHTLTISDENSSEISITNISLKKLTEDELKGHFNIWDEREQRWSLDDESYDYIPNFARVKNLEGYYGGHNIFNNVPELDVGNSNEWFADNNYIDGEIKEAGETYTETQKIIPANHAQIISEDHRWNCSYTIKYDPPSSNKDKCLIGYEKKQVRDCMQYQYDSAGRQTDTCLYYGPWYDVDDLQKPKYKEPCTESVPATCTHNQTYYELIKNKDDKGGTAPYESSARVHVPYNFNMSAKMSISDRYAYVGETVTVNNIEVKVNNRRNNTTNGDYSTKVASEVNVQFATFISNTDKSSNEMVNSLPGNASIENESHKVADSMSAGEVVTPDLSVTVNVNDIDLTSAGKWFCVAIRVSPGDSGTDTTMDASGYSGYRTSGIVCRQMAKRPTLEVWGGNLFSNGSINTSTAIKNNNNQFGYVVTGPNVEGKEKIYGSWGELGVMVLETNTGFASGNSLYSINPDTYPSGLLVDASSSKQAFCNAESILTFANFNKGGSNICNGTSIFTRTGAFGVGIRNIDKRAIIREFIEDDTKTNCNGAININGNHFNTGNPDAKIIDRVTVNDTVAKSLYCSGAISFGGSLVGFGSTAGKDSVVRDRGTTWIVRSDEDITITGNIVYDESKGYTSFNSMQKLIIYSGKNININCDVERIDAVLIAGKDVNTCINTTSSSNDWARNHRLKINGAVIADRLIPGRSYGANGYTYPVEPAEVINHDSSLLLWGRAQADVSESNKTYTTYTRELAPRY